MTDSIDDNKRLVANRNNGLKGGVKTPEGKAISSQNAKVHGVLSLRILPEEQEEYLHVYEQMQKELTPTDTVQKIIVERLAFHVIQMQRVSFAKNEFLLQRKHPRRVIEHSPSDCLAESFGFKTEVIDEGYSPQVDGDDVERLLDLYHRYEVAVENRFYKAVRELNQLRGL